MKQDFYDKVAEKFGKYSTGVKSKREFPDGDPEADFKAELIKLAGTDKKVLDVGCADGRFTLSIAPYFGQVTAIDNSEGMLSSAGNTQKSSGVVNVNFEKVDFYHNKLPSESYDVIYSRRGPTDYSEFFRLLKMGGSYVGIEIGENDTRGIKEVFGRGQNFGKWDRSVLGRDKKDMESAGFEITLAKEYTYDEYYALPADLDRFLQGVPIFEDYDSVKDKINLDKYVVQNTTSKGINLPRHRVVFAAVKPSSRTK